MTRVSLEEKLLEKRFPWECRTSHPYDEVVPWCEEHFGPFDQEWYRFGSDIANGVLGWQQDVYRFCNERDAVLFRLKWS